MAVLTFYVKVLFLFCVVKSGKSFDKSTCVDDFMDIDAKNKVNISQYCDGRHCIPKCCKQMNRVIYSTTDLETCKDIKEIEKIENISINVDKIKFDIYKNNIAENIQKVDSKGNNDSIQFVVNIKMATFDCIDDNRLDGSTYDAYILENGSLIMDQNNSDNRWRIVTSSIRDYCKDHVVEKTKEGLVKDPYFIIKFYKFSENKPAIVEPAANIFYAIGMLISCFFLAMVLFVYGAIRELRNLVGLILMAYVGTLSLTFFIRALLFLNPSYDPKFCMPMGIILYYLILSTFLWMNVMSLDIWWTFRALFKSRQIHRRGELAKFAWYGLYSWGLPLLVTITVAVIDSMDLNLPEVYKIHFDSCEPAVYYLRDLPCLALIVLNWIFFLMTTFNIWRIRRNMAQFSNESSKYNNNKHRFGLYLKLSLVMGVNWLLEDINFPLWLEYIINAYNCLNGVAIFIIFVCKRKILIMLCKRFSIKGNLVENLQRKYSKSSTNTTHSDRKRSALDLEVTASSSTT